MGLRSPARGGRVGGGASRKEARTIRTNTTRTNLEITAHEVRLIDEAGKQLGIVPVPQAIERAQGKGLDLVEVAPDADPPVCRIMDFTKYAFEQKRKMKVAKKKTVRVETKEIKLRPNIDPHDFGIKLDHIKEFLDKGHKVKVTLRYRPREMRHYEIGTQVLSRLVAGVGERAMVESEAQRGESMRMQSIMITPKKKAPGAAAKDANDSFEE